MGRLTAPNIIGGQRLPFKIVSDAPKFRENPAIPPSEFRERNRMKEKLGDVAYKHILWSSQFEQHM